jgi:hypothetical protein
MCLPLLREPTMMGSLALLRRCDGALRAQENCAVFRIGWVARAVMLNTNHYPIFLAQNSIKLAALLTFVEPHRKRECSVKENFVSKISMSKNK